jgi:O-antigen ligase
MATVPQLTIGRISSPDIRRYLFALGLCYLAVVLYLLIEKSPRYWGMALGLPVAIFIATQPRLAVYQFLFCLLLDFQIIAEPAVFLIDLSAGLLILTGLLDYLLANSERMPRPPMTMNYLFLIVTLFIAGAFGFEPLAAINPIVRVSVLLAVFLSLVRLSRHVTFAEAFRVLFILMIVHSLIAFGPALASGGKIRSLGLAGSVFDDTAMLVIPYGLAMYLWLPLKSRRWYLLGTLVVLIGLIGTQTRFAILICLILSAVVLLVSLWRARALRRRTEIDHTPAEAVVKRVSVLVLAVAVVTLLFVIFVPSILERAYDRFSAAASVTPGGTMLLRTTLWHAALTVFADHPLTGIGPGLFRTVDQYYGSLMFGPTQVFVRGLSAHNLLLHYLAESGLLGAVALLMFFGNQFRLARRLWRSTASAYDLPFYCGLVVVSFGIFLTTFAEGSWMWGGTGFLAAFFIAGIATEYRRSLARASHPV